MTWTPSPGDRCRLPSGDIVTVKGCHPVHGPHNEPVRYMVQVQFDSGSELAVSVTLLEPV